MVEQGWRVDDFDGVLTLHRGVCGRAELRLDGTDVIIAWEDSGCFEVVQVCPLEALAEFVRRAQAGDERGVVDVDRADLEAHLPWPDRHPYTGERFIKCAIEKHSPRTIIGEKCFTTASGSMAWGEWCGEWRWSRGEYHAPAAPGTQDGWLTDPTKRGEAVD